MEVKQLDVHELKSKLDSENPPVLLDVREKAEREFTNIKGEFIPLGELPDRTGELADHKDKEVVIYCRSGARSAEACKLLQQEGFSDVKNLEGGLLAWSQEIDPSIPQY